MANSYFQDETTTGPTNSGFSVRLRGLAILSNTSANSIDGRLLIGDFEANGTGIFLNGIPVVGGSSNLASYLQVANAAATYQTIAIELAHLANTNIAIKDRYQVANVNILLNAKATWSALLSTNTALRLLISDRLQVANASSLYTTKINPITSGVHAHTGRITVSTNADISGNTSTNKLSVTNRMSSIGNNVFGAINKRTIINALLSSNGVIDGINVKTVGNTVLGAAGKRAIINGLISANGRMTIATNLDVTGNTSSNKLSVTNRLVSAGNNVFGAASKRSIINGLLSANGRVDVAGNLNVTGNSVLGVAGKRSIVNGLLSSNGRITVSTNITIVGNTNLGSHAWYSTIPSTTHANTVGLAHIIPEIQNGAYQIALDDFNQMKRKTGGAASSITIANTATVNYPIGFCFSSRNVSANTLTIARAGGVQLRKAGSSTNADVATGQWSFVSYTHEASNQWIASGTY